MRQFTLGIVAAGLVGVLAVGSIAADDNKGKGKGIEKAFAKRDTNGDGKLSLEEFKKGLPEERSGNADKRFAKMDSNGDGGVTLEEYKAALGKAQDKKKKE